MMKIPLTVVLILSNLVVLQRILVESQAQTRPLRHLDLATRCVRADLNHHNPTRKYMTANVTFNVVCGFRTLTR